MSLTALVNQLGQNSVKGISSRNQDALKVLRSFWSGNLTESLDTISFLIEDNPFTPSRFILYRAWIEILAELGEKASLVLLAKHLFVRGQAEPEDHETYFCLRGLIDLELDSISAVRLSVLATKNSTNPYALELNQIFEQRSFSKSEDEYIPRLLEASGSLVDFFHWQAIARSIHLIQIDDNFSQVIRDDAAGALDALFKFAKKIFYGTPLPNLFSFHRYIDSRDFSAAAVVAQELVRAYPSNGEYRYFFAFALFEEGNYPLAKATLDKYVSNFGDEDPEVISLLGQVNAKLGNSTVAEEYLEQSAKLLKQQGLPFSNIVVELNEVTEDIQKVSPLSETKIKKDRAYWFVELSPRRYHEMLSESDQVVAQLLRPMGIGPNPGDVVYLGVRFKSDINEKSFKIIADYSVESTPIWHPIDQYQSYLKLDSRYDVGVIVHDLSLKQAGISAQEKAYYDLHANLGIFELDQVGISQIKSSLEEHLSEHFTERRIDGGNTRIDVG